MSNETQTAFDVLVLGMTDAAVIQAIESHADIGADQGLAEHLHVASQLITALDNMYGEGSYHKYKADGTLPSQQ